MKGLVTGMSNWHNAPLPTSFTDLCNKGPVTNQNNSQQHLPYDHSFCQTKVWQDSPKVTALFLYSAPSPARWDQSLPQRQPHSEQTQQIHSPAACRQHWHLPRPRRHHKLFPRNLGATSPLCLNIHPLLPWLVTSPCLQNTEIFCFTETAERSTGINQEKQRSRGTWTTCGIWTLSKCRWRCCLFSTCRISILK